MKKIIIITGASDGIGKAAARELHNQGHEVVLIGRSPEKTEAVAQELGAKFYVVDFAKLNEVRDLAKAIKKDYAQIDVLALNAGGIFSKRLLTDDGIERTFQINHLAHFLLVKLLLPTLLKSHATVIATSSSAHSFSRLDIGGLNAERGYRKWTVYGNAKLMNILFVRELTRRYGAKGINAAAFHPGLVATGFSRDLSRPLKFIFNSKLSRSFGLVTPEQGADTLVWLATHTPSRDWKSGEYYNKRKVTRTSSKASDAGLAQDVWSKSEALLERGN